jgi:hypothetical protein
MSAPAPKAPPAPPPESTNARTMPSLDELLRRCRPDADCASTLARSVLRNRTSASNPRGAAELKSVGGASRRGSAVQPTSAKTPNTDIQRGRQVFQHRRTLLRVAFIVRYLLAHSPADSVPHRGGIDRSGRLGREDYRNGRDNEHRPDHHHQAVGGEHEAFSRHEVVEHLADHLSI